MKIKFDIARPEYSWAEKPIPALSSLPDWYKDMKAFENKENKGKSNFPPPPPRPMDEHRPPPPPRDWDHPRGSREGNRPPPPHWDQDRPGRPGDENRPPPPPRDFDEN